MYHMNYSTNPWKKRIPVFLAMLLLAGMIALNVFVPVPEPDADVSCPMANANVTWLETYFPGPWEVGE